MTNIIDFKLRPHFRKYETAEPYIEYLVYKYYRAHFDEEDAAMFTRQYLDFQKNQSTITLTPKCEPYEDNDWK